MVLTNLTQFQAPCMFEMVQISEKITSIEYMRKFFQQSGSVFFDSMDCAEFKYPEHFDSTVFKKFLQMAGITNTIGDKKVLENLRLITSSDKFTYAAAMMFEKMSNILLTMQQSGVSFSKEPTKDILLIAKR